MSVQPKGSPAHAQGLPDAAAAADEGPERGHGADRLAGGGAEGLLRQAAAGARRVAEGDVDARARPQPAGQAARRHLRTPAAAARRVRRSARCRCCSTSQEIEHASRPRRRSGSAWSRKARSTGTARSTSISSAERRRRASHRASTPRRRSGHRHRPRPSAEPVEPTHGPQLMDHVQLGFAYQMHLEGPVAEGAPELRQPGPHLLRLHARQQAPADDLDDLAHARAHVRDQPPARLRERLPDRARHGARAQQLASWRRRARHAPAPSGTDADAAASR